MATMNAHVCAAPLRTTPLKYIPVDMTVPSLHSPRLLLRLLALVALACASPPTPPPLTSLETDFIPAFPLDRDLPVTCNFWGCTGSVGLSSLSALQVYPYSLRNIQVRGRGRGRVRVLLTR